MELMAQGARLVIKNLQRKAADIRVGAQRGKEISNRSQFCPKPRILQVNGMDVSQV
jgi:hypothetical protein